MSFWSMFSSPLRRALRLIPGLAVRLRPYVPRAVDILVAATPTKIDDVAWQAFLARYPTLASHRSELSPAEREVAVRILLALMAKRELDVRDDAALRAAIELVSSEKTPPSK